MNMYLADMFFTDGRVRAIHFEAVDMDEAVEIASDQGWELLGELEDVIECPDDVIAMVELRLSDTKIH